MFPRSKRVALYAASLTLCGAALLAMRWRPASPPSKPQRSNPDDFDATRAFADLKHLVGFGPRPAGSQNLERARQWIIDQLSQAGVSTQEDSFVAPTPLGPIPVTNVVAKIPGTSPSIVIIAGHYDTKRMATPFVGANDGGSSAAFLLEMARVLAHRRNKLTYWVVFFDGEEAVQRVLSVKLRDSA